MAKRKKGKIHGYNGGQHAVGWCDRRMLEVEMELHLEGAAGRRRKGRAGHTPLINLVLGKDGYNMVDLMHQKIKHVLSI